MKSAKKSKILGVVLSVVLLVAMAGMAVPALATDGGAILHPGYISGSVSVDGYNITQIKVGATDTTKSYWATVVVGSAPASSIDYKLTVEGGYDYNVVAWARIVSADPTVAWLPMVGPYSVAVGETVPDVDLSMTPAFVEGTISTGNTDDIISLFNLRARTYVPEYYEPNLDSWTSASGLTAPGDPGRDYRLLVAPGLDYRLWGDVVINGINYDVPVYDFTAPGAGGTLTWDLPFVVTRATVSGIARLEGPVDVAKTGVEVRATAKNPTRIIITKPDPDTGAYTLELTADTWYLNAYFPFVHTGAGLEGLYGNLRVPVTEVTLAPDESKTIDFIIQPGFISGTLSLTGANTEWWGGWVQADSQIIPGGKLSSYFLEDGKYMFVASPGDWRYGYWFLLTWNYYDESNNYIGRSDIWKYISSDIYTVVSGETVAGLDLAFGTATVKLMYYVAGGGELSKPTLRAYGPVTAMNVWGSNTKPTEGQAICTLIPGTYNISAWARVDGSTTSFGTFTVTVADGDMVVIGGVAGPTLTVTSPTQGEVIPAPSVTVEGTATDDVGIESITINGEPVTFEPTGGPNNEVVFSHEVSLPDVGENAITVVAQDIDGMPEVTCSFKVIRQEIATPTTLTYTGDALAQVNTPAALAATLVDEDVQPVSGAEISFQVASQSCSALTGADGVASCEVIIPTAGVYEVTADFAGDVSHKPSTATALLTVYNPEGGFVTGGGWIASPEGAYTADPTLSGRANFGFVSKYQKGASTPTGQTEFQFKVADLNFHSNTYEWLVVAGARAQYKGTGTINGEGNYGFMLTAIDEKLTSSTDVDMFRIKIWDKATDAVVYDNKMGAGDDADPTTGIGGGSIVIHKQ